MPYKDPERKRQWEREHRERRNAKRKMQHITARSGQPSIAKSSPDPVSNQKSQDTWRTILGWAIGIGVVLFAAIAGVNPSASVPRQR
jgi:hypothetical protein